MPHAIRASCALIRVLLVGRTAASASLHELLARFAHPIHRVPTWSAAEQAVTGMRVAVLFSLPPGDLIDGTDRLRARTSGLRVILALPAADAELEQLVMLREYLHLTVLGPNLEVVHALVHDVLRVTRNPEPSALRGVVDRS